MKKEMPWLAYRHNILEIMVDAVAVKSLGAPNVPDILLFKRFKISWNSIDHDKFQTSVTDNYINKETTENASKIIEFAQNQLIDFQTRVEYKEALQLAIIFLGGVPEKDINFTGPGVLHRAR